MSSLLTAMGETKLLMEMAALSLVLGIPVAFFLVPKFGIIGMIIGLQVTALPSTFIGLYQIWKHYGTKTDFAGSAKILLASTLATATVYLFLVLFTTAYWVSLVVGTIFFAVVYLISAPLVGAINQSDVNNLKSMFSGSGVISKFLEIPLTVIDKILEKRGSQNKSEY
jgi:O-antigen/teichoic acid export membrane protein